MNCDSGNPDYNNNDRNWTNANNGNNKKENNNTKNVNDIYNANNTPVGYKNYKGMQKGNESDKKLKYDPPADYKYEVHLCICNRPQQAFECGRCHHFFHGRIYERCKQHPLDYFLMEFHQCPYCCAPTTEAKVSKLSWAQIRKIEDASLPNDDDEW